MFNWIKQRWETHKAMKRVRRFVASGNDAMSRGPMREDCPVCGAEDVIVDIPLHGPGVGALDWECGCSATFKQGEPSKYVRYDGEVFYKEREEVEAENEGS